MAESALFSVDQHAAAVRGLLASRTAVRTLPLAQCLGLALASDLVSAISLPPFDNSAMDGYAVRSADVAEASPSSPVSLPVAEDIPAGRGDAPPLLAGTAHRIMTGAPVPPGADAVVPVELTDGGTPVVSISAAVAPGRHVRRTGEDVASGSVVLGAGATLGAAQLGVASAVGCAALAVHEPPRVLVLSTGSELAEPGAPLRPGQIYESNSAMLAAAVRSAGGLASVARFVADDVPAFLAAVDAALAESPVELVLTSGGVSAGAYEVVRDALLAHGVRFVKVAMNPGMPQGLGSYRGTPVVTLPGNPVSALVSFEVFVRPALRAAGGHAAADRPLVVARLDSAARSPAGKRQFRRGRLRPGGTVTLVGGPGSHLLASFAASDCLVELPEEAVEVPAGTEVRVHVLTP